MNKKYTYEYIDIIFENCNWVRIPSNLIRFLDLTDITDNYFANAVQQFMHHRAAKRVSILLLNDAINIKTKFQLEYPNTETYVISSFKNHLDLYRDITGISIKQANKKEFEILVPWGGEDINSINPLQMVKYEEKEFTITIKE